MSNDGFLTGNLGTHWFVNGEPAGAARRINYLGSPEAVELVKTNEVQADGSTVEVYTINFTPLASGGIGGTPDVAITGRDLNVNMTRNLNVEIADSITLSTAVDFIASSTVGGFFRLQGGIATIAADEVAFLGGLITGGGGIAKDFADPVDPQDLATRAFAESLVAAGVPDPLTLDDLTVNNNIVLVGNIDSTGNDSSWYVSSGGIIATAGLEFHGPDGVIVDAATGYVSMYAGGSAATGLDPGVMQIDTLDRFQVISQGGGVYIEALGASMDLFGETVWHGGVTATSGTVELGTSAGAGEYPAALTIGGRPGSGTHAVDIGGRTLVLRAATTTLLDAGTTLTIGGTFATAVNVGRAAAPLALFGSGALTYNGVTVGGGTADEVTDGTGTAGFLGSAGVWSTTGLASFSWGVGAGSAYVSAGTGELDLYHETGPINITAVDGDAAIMLDPSNSTIDVTGPLTITSRGFRLSAQTRPTTDVRGYPMQEIVGRATSLSSGSTTAANKIGPHKVTELGRAQTEGTDLPGSWFIGLGNLVSTNAPGLSFGHGAAIGTPGTDAYRPFTTEIGNVGVLGGNFSFSSSTGVVVNGGTSQLYVATSYAGLSALGTTQLVAGGNASLTAYYGSGNIVLRGVGLGEYDVNGAARIYSRFSRVIEIGDSSVDRIYLRFPADTATTDATLTTLATFTPTTRPSTYTIEIHAFTASGAACAYWSKKVKGVLRAGAAVIDSAAVTAVTPTVAPDCNDAGGSLAAAALTIDTSGTSIRVRGAGIAATNLTWVVTVGAGEVQ